MQNKQEMMWDSSFGRDYTNRNMRTPEEYDEFYMELYGVTRTKLNNEFIGSMDRNMRILEVGANIGNQLILLHKIGFKNLYGVELQYYPVKASKAYEYNITMLQASSSHLPFKDKTFDLVFTAGVLIHIAPELLKRIMKEICRCTRHYIWGFEYYNLGFREINYRENNELLWEGNYSHEYLKHCPDLQIVKENKYKYLNSNSENAMFLLSKRA